MHGFNDRRFLQPEVTFQHRNRGHDIRRKRLGMRSMRHSNDDRDFGCAKVANDVFYGAGLETWETNSEII